MDLATALRMHTRHGAWASFEEDRKGSVDDRVASYGQVIVDECHHLPAFSFERVLNQVKAKYIVGLTATPQRRDGHHPITGMQLGPVRFSVDAKSQADKLIAKLKSRRASRRRAVSARSVGAAGRGPTPRPPRGSAARSRTSPSSRA